MAKTSQSSEPIKVEVASPTAAPEKTKEEKTVAQAQADQMYGKANDHAPLVPKRLDYELNDGIPSSGAPPAQGPNISKEEAEFAANQSKAGGELQPEKTPASTEV